MSSHASSSSVTTFTFSRNDRRNAFVYNSQNEVVYAIETLSIPESHGDPTFVYRTDNSGSSFGDLVVQLDFRKRPHELESQGQTKIINEMFPKKGWPTPSVRLLTSPDPPVVVQNSNDEN
jgi:hypothetical protein